MFYNYNRKLHEIQPNYECCCSFTSISPTQPKCPALHFFHIFMFSATTTTTFMRDAILPKPTKKKQQQKMCQHNEKQNYKLIQINILKRMFLINEFLFFLSLTLVGSGCVRAQPTAYAKYACKCNMFNMFGFPVVTLRFQLNKKKNKKTIIYSFAFCSSISTHSHTIPAKLSQPWVSHSCERSHVLI